MIEQVHGYLRQQPLVEIRLRADELTSRIFDAVEGPLDLHQHRVRVTAYPVIRVALNKCPNSCTHQARRGDSCIGIACSLTGFDCYHIAARLGDLGDSIILGCNCCVEERCILLEQLRSPVNLVPDITNLSL